METGKIKSKPPGSTSIRSVDPAGNKNLEDQEESTNFLKKQVERTDRSRYDICEVFSPPRVCVVATDHGLRGGWSIDVSTRDPITGKCYDLRNPKEQKEVKKRIRRYCPPSAGGVTTMHCLLYREPGRG